MPIIVSQTSSPTSTSTAPTPPAGGANKAEIIRRIQVELDDPSGKRFDYNYVDGFIAQRTDDIFVEFSAYGLQYADQTAVLDSVPANTTDLTGYMGSGQALGNMMEPVALDWKNPTDDDINYRPVGKVDKIIDTKDAADEQSWAWIGGILYISGFNTALTLRVRFKTLATALVDPTDTPIRGAANIFVYAVAKAIAKSNGARQLMADIDVDLQNAKDFFEKLMIKQEQQVPRQIGRAMRRMRTPLWRPPTV